MLSEAKLGILERFGDRDTQDLVAEVRRLSETVRTLQSRIQVTRIDAAIRLLVDSGDMTPLAVRQINAVLNIGQEEGGSDG